MLHSQQPKLHEKCVFVSKKNAGKYGVCFHFIIRKSGNSENSLCGQTEQQMSSSPSCAFFASTAGRRSLPANPINQPFHVEGFQDTPMSIHHFHFPL